MKFILFLKNILGKIFRNILASLGGEGFGSNNLELDKLVKYFFIQKIVGINRNVSWPVSFTSKIISPEKIERGSRFPGLSNNCYIDGRNGILIGKNTWIGPGVKIISMNHEHNNYKKYKKTKKIKIGTNCWIASNSIILAGVELADHTIVSAGSVVNKSFFDKNIMIGGNPAKIIKQLDKYKD